jgi:hypothetical protein
MATVGYHVLHGTQTVVLAADAEYNGELFPAGTYEFDVDGRYWTDFDRRHPIEGLARGQAWSGTAHGLVAELGVGTVTHTTLQMGIAFSGLLGGVGLFGLLLGFGLIWASREKKPVELLSPPAVTTEPLPEIETLKDTVSVG